MSAGCLGTSEAGESGKTSKGVAARIFLFFQTKAEELFLKTGSGVVQCGSEREKRLWNRNQTNI